ncbi:hypothetical protein YC2023_068246 [Brassica napus]
MALVYRSLLLQHLPCPSVTPLLRNYPLKPLKFSSQPFSHRCRQSPASSSSSSARCCSSSSSMESPPEGYRRNVGVCLMNPSKKIFAASRLDIPSAWQMPQGGIDEGEDPRVAVMRELKEETGVHSAEIIAEAPHWITYDFPPDVREKLKVRWGSDWKGQAQKWFLLKFTGKDEEINLLGDGTEQPEFGEWSWVSPDQLVELAVDFKKPVYKEVMSAFASHLHSHFSVRLKMILSLEGQLGRIGRDSKSLAKRVEGLENVRVRRAFASGVVSTAVGDDGSLWVWGRSKRGQLGLGKGIVEALVPSKVEALCQEHIVKVSLGWGHVLALSADGKVFGWGYVADGRVGNVGLPLEASPLDSLASGYGEEAAEKKVAEAMRKESNMPIAWEPRLVEELRGVKVEDIACGSDHSLVLCRDGTLLSSGSNVYGQLGRRNKQDLGMSPVDITGSPVSVAAGLGHSLAICNVESDSSNTRRVVSSWGWNRSQQLGRGKPEELPREVEGFDGETPASVSAGRVHSLCVTEKGEAWVWGCGRSGRLGLGSSVDEPEPMLLEDVEGCVLQAVAGFDHSLILVSDCV